MAVKASNQVDLVDLTDGHSVNLSVDNCTFQGDATAVVGTQTVETQVMAMRGADQVACSVGAISTPTGISAVSDGKSPSPKITITATSAVKTGGSFEIPIIISTNSGDITFVKVFSFSIAFRGEDGTSVTISNQSVTYQGGTSGTTVPTGAWSATIPSVPAGQFLWTKTEVAYSDGKKTTAYSVSRIAGDGTSVTITSTETTYQAGTSGTTPPTGDWSPTPVSGSAGGYVWTRTIVNYSDGSKTTSYSVARNGTNGANGSDAISIAITSSGGFIFKNTAIATTLTAHVYKGAVELTGSSLTAEGVVKWYKDGGTTAIATGTTFTITAGDVESKASYTAQLED